MVLLLAGGGAWLVFGSDDDSGDGEDRPSGIIATRLARQVDLNITRAQFDKAVKNLEPVTTKTQRSKRSVNDVDKIPKQLRAEYKRKYGVKNGKVIIPAQTYNCLLYHGEKPEDYAWQFCFGEAGRLEFVSTTPPLKS